MYGDRDGVFMNLDPSMSNYVVLTTSATARIPGRFDGDIGNGVPSPNHK